MRRLKPALVLLLCAFICGACQNPTTLPPLTYSVSYLGNGASGSPVGDSGLYPAGATAIVKDKGSLVLEGSSFTEWNTRADGSGTAYVPGASLTIGTDNVILYAQWRAMDRYRLSYASNGGSGQVNIDNYNYLAGETATVGGQASLSWAGRDFLGWNTQADGLGTDYAPGSSLTMPATDQVLYARWGLHPFGVSYLAPGASGSGPSDASTYTIGQSVTVLGQGSLSKSGYVFEGWYDGAVGPGTVYAPGTALTMGPANLALYAAWRLVPASSVVYLANGGSGAPPVDSQSHAEASAVTVLDKASLYWHGHVFAGWNTQADGLGASHAPGSTLAMPATTVYLHAQWTALPARSVSYHGNGGAGSPPSDAAVYYQGDVVAVLGPASLGLTGYAFSGWNSLASGLGTAYAQGASLTIGASNVDLWAQWAIQSYHVSYSANGGTGTAPTDAASHAYGSTVTLAGQGGLSKAGYAFSGWNTLANGTGTAYAASSTMSMGPGDSVLYAQWTPLPTYAVTYLANLGSGTPPTDAGTYLSGATVTVAGSGSLGRTGYAFSGWNTLANGTGTAYAAGGTLSMGSANVILYAQWTALPTYTVSYLANGATGTAPTDAGAYLPGATVTTQGPGSLSNSGYTFTGWNTLANGLGTAYAAGASISMGSANVVLFAQWTALPTYTVSYFANGGSGTAPSDPTNYLSGASATVLGQGALTRSGYAFSGWNTNAGGTGTNYAAGASLSIALANVSLYAKWTLLPTYRVYYYGNTSTGGTAPTDTTYYLQGASVTVASPGTLVKTGNTFAGWNTLASGLGTAYAAGATLVMGGATQNLYAQWALNSYVVSYDDQGATVAPSPASAIVTYPATNVGSLPTSPTKTGYTFGGWYTAVNGGGTAFYGSTTVSANLTVYAKWNPITYTVYFDSQSATVAASPTSKAVTVPATVVDALPTAPTKTGYSFGGWFTSTNGGGTTFTASTEVGDMTWVYAYWIPNSYIVTYDSQGATFPASPSNAAVTYPATTVASLPTAPTRTGYIFGGWYTAPGGGGSQFLSYTAVSSALTVYAKWTLISYTVSFDSQLATVAANPTSMTVSYPATSLASLPAEPTRTGYTFGGWYTGTYGTGSAFSSSTPVGASLTVYAYWIANSYVVSYDSQGATVPASPTSKTVTFPTVTVLSLPTAPTKAGYTFGGWYTATNGGGTQFLSSTTVSASITVYAKWTGIPYTVSFNSQSATIAASPTSKVVTAPATTVDALPTPPTKTGYSFAGWYTGAVGTGTVFDATTAVGANLTVYAYWIANTYTVTYDSQGATVPASPGSASLTYPTTTVGSLPTAPSKTGYAFGGWYTAINGGGTSFGANTVVGSDITVYAKWTANSYTVSFDSQAATVAASPATKTVTFPATTVDALPTAPSKTGYAFGGWFSAINGGGFPFAASSTVSASTTVYAYWIANSYTVSYDSQGAGQAANPSSQVVTYPATTVGSLPEEPIRDGFGFGGWYTAPNGAGTAFLATTTVSAGITVYANWLLPGTTWTTRSLPSGNNWDGIAYGNGTFAAVGYNFIDAATSPDGVTWTARTLPAASTWAHMAYGNGSFVAITQDGGLSATSPDGITWTSHPMPTTASWICLTYGNGLFVALSYDSNAALTSPDGETWTARTLPKTSVWDDVCYGNGQFVAVSGCNNFFLTSPDGITWTARPMASTYSWGAVTYAEGLYVVVAALSSKFATSPDGINWTVRDMPVYANWVDICYGNGFFTALALNSAIVATSPDGLNWTQGTLPSSQTWNALAFGHGRFVAVCNGSTLATSP